MNCSARSFSENTPGKLINQFPFEMVVTIKDMMAMVARRAPRRQPPSEDGLTTHPKWLAATYNLQTELPQFVSFFQHRQARYVHRSLLLLLPDTALPQHAEDTCGRTGKIRIFSFLGAMQCIRTVINACKQCVQKN